jgi:hypothetical protein
MVFPCRFIEGQSDPAFLQELYEQHIRLRRASTVEDIERGKEAESSPPPRMPSFW